jgi:hypothetical protein
VHEINPIGIHYRPLFSFEREKNLGSKEGALVPEQLPPDWNVFAKLLWRHHLGTKDLQICS